jgi:hypothetical protein
MKISFGPQIIQIYNPVAGIVCLKGPSNSTMTLVMPAMPPLFSESKGCRGDQHFIILERIPRIFASECEQFNISCVFCVYLE